MNKKKALRLRSLASTGYTVEQISKKLNMNMTDVECKLTEYGIRPIYDPPKPKKADKPATAVSKPKPKPEYAKLPKGVTDEMADQMLLLRLQGMPYKSIAKYYKLPYSTVYRFLKSLEAEAGGI